MYEHVYETVDVGGSPEVRASATAKVTLDNTVWVFYEIIETVDFSVLSLLLIKILNSAILSTKRIVTKNCIFGTQFNGCEEI